MPPLDDRPDDRPHDRSDEAADGTRPDGAADDEAALRAHAATLAAAVEVALPGWVERSVAQRMTELTGGVPTAVAEDARRAGLAAREVTVPRLRQLPGQDVDEQRSTPLEVVRRAVRFPGDVLRAAGVAPVHRDEHSELAFPDDTFDLVPAQWADVDPALAEPGLTWGAAKAYVILARRRQEGRR